MVIDRRGGNMTNMIVQVARLYHEKGMTQPAIAEMLHISQSRVSRWLKVATEEGIVRTVVIPPDGVFPILEEQLSEKYGLRQALVVDVAGDERSIMAGLGTAAAAYLDSTLEMGARIGFSSWSETLLTMVNSMQPLRQRRAESIVQIMGGIGNPNAQIKATQLTQQLARMTGAEPVFLPAPGVVGSQSARDALFEDDYVQEAARHWGQLTDVLLGIGSVSPSPLLQGSGNSVSPQEMETLGAAGAVGDVAMRFYNAKGQFVPTELNDRVVGIGVEELRQIPRKIGIAGGERKLRAIAGAISGGWVDVLITDVATARELVSTSD